MKPNYLCIGVQKGGTTSLNAYMNYHPEIYMAHGERHFFDRKLSEGELTKKNIENYENYFKTTKSIIGEKTPSYNYLRYAIDRIYNYDKNIKLIILLREPISRSYSQFNMDLIRYQNKNLKDLSNKEIEDEFKNLENQKLCDMTSNDGNFYSEGIL